MRDYETLRQRHQAYALALAPRRIERLDWPAKLRRFVPLADMPPHLVSEEHVLAAAK